MLKEDERFQEGFERAISGEYEEAKAIFKEIDNEDTLFTNVHTYLRVIKDAQNQTIKKTTSDNLFKAFSYGRLSSDTNKIKYLKLAIQSDPDYFISYKELGNARYYCNAYDDAISNYHKALSLDSSYFDLYYNLALSYDESGQEKKALFYYKKFISSQKTTNNRYVQYANYRILELESFSF